MRHEVPPHDNRFCHVALFYADEYDYLEGAEPYIRDGLRSGEPVLVVETHDKLQLLRRELGADADEVQFASMEEVGANPARIIPAWQDFLTRCAEPGRTLRGIGEPIWAGRYPDEVADCQWHESLLNVAFGTGRPWTLLCPYDVAHLDDALIEEARRSHEWVMEAGSIRASAEFRGLVASGAPFAAPLPLPPQPDVLPEISFDASNLRAVRALVSRHAIGAGLDGARAAQLVTAVNEVATNSVRHGGGGGHLCIWLDAGKVVCEIRDRGLFDRPLVDRQLPNDDPWASRGLWLANQLCDLVQIRTFREETVVRLHLAVSPRRGLSIVPDQPAAAV